MFIERFCVYFHLYFQIQIQAIKIKLSFPQRPTKPQHTGEVREFSYLIQGLVAVWQGNGYCVCSGISAVSLSHSLFWSYWYSITYYVFTFNL